MHEVYKSLRWSPIKTRPSKFFDLGKVSLISRFSGVLHLLLFIAGVQETNK